MQKQAIYLVDGTSICYRSFFAIKLSTSKGVPSGAVYGFYKTLKKIMSKYDPSYMGICFDVSRKTHRHQKYKEYKIHRPPMPDELGVQIPIIKKMIKSLGIAIIEKEGFEADDIIATVSKRAKDNNRDAVIVTMDKDMYQLLEKDKVVVFNPNQDRVLDENNFFEEYGFLPANIVDFLSLAGDASDNIPGAKGIGKVGAAKLIKEFGTVENIFNSLDKLSPKMKEIIVQNKDSIVLSKDLVQLHTCDVDTEWEGLKIKEADYNGLYEIFTDLEFKSLLKDFSAPKVDLGIKVEEPQSLDFLKHVDKEKLVFFSRKGSVYILNKKHDGVYKTKAQNVKDLLEDDNIKKISYGFKREMVALPDISMKGVWFDVKIAAYLIDIAFSDYDLSTLIYHYLEQALAEVPAESAPLFIYKLYKIFSKKLEKEGLDKLFFDVEMKLIEVLADMEKWGVRVDIKALRDLLVEVEEKLIKAREEIFKIAGREFNLNSHQQLRAVLFEELKIPPLGKTKTGYSTNEEVLTKLAVNYPIAKLLLEYRQLNKLKTTYVQPLITDVEHYQGYLHAKFNQASTQTGRLSSSSPNLQSIPAKGEFSSHLRRAFISSFEGGYILSADYSQIELRILAHFTGDEKLIDVFNKGEDIHKFTASLLFGIDENQVEAAQRNVAKRVNFGIIYGMGSYRLAQDLGIKPKEAQAFIDEYFLRYPKVAEYIQMIHKELEDNGFVRTILGRKRSLPDFNSPNVGLREFSRRQAINTPIQGSCADLIKVAMVNIYSELKERKLKTRLIIQIHDELIFDIPKDELDEVKDIVKKYMETSIKLSVPVEVNINHGSNWAEVK
jgi:DNA polymerase-1